MKKHTPTVLDYPFLCTMAQLTICPGLTVLVDNLVGFTTDGNFYIRSQRIFGFQKFLMYSILQKFV